MIFNPPCHIAETILIANTAISWDIANIFASGIKKKNRNKASIVFITKKINLDNTSVYSASDTKKQTTEARDEINIDNNTRVKAGSLMSSFQLNIESINDIVSPKSTSRTKLKPTKAIAETTKITNGNPSCQLLSFFKTNVQRNMTIKKKRPYSIISHENIFWEKILILAISFSPVTLLKNKPVACMESIRFHLS